MIILIPSIHMANESKYPNNTKKHKQGSKWVLVLWTEKLDRERDNVGVAIAPIGTP